VTWLLYLNDRKTKKTAARHFAMKWFTFAHVENFFVFFYKWLIEEATPT